MKPGDRVEIHKPEHPSDGKIGVLLHIDESAWPHYAFVAAENYTPAKVWPTYVVKPRNILVIEECEREAGAQKVEEIIAAVEAQGRPLRILMGIEGAL